MPVDIGPDPLLSGDGRLLFAFAHQLRGHLRTVLTRTQLVVQEGSSALCSDDKLLLDEVARAAGEIDGLVDAMVAFCSVRSSKGESRLATVVQGALLGVKRRLTEANGRVDVGNPPDVFVPDALQAVLQELLNNSCKFLRLQLPLLVRLSWVERSDGAGATTLEMTVSDNGIGVDPEYAERIFEPFERLHCPSAYRGHGMGLAIARRIARAWGGDITAIPAPEPGLSLVVRIPLTGELP
jgi:signal transduction histidine kinase